MIYMVDTNYVSETYHLSDTNKNDHLFEIQLVLEKFFIM